MVTASLLFVVTVVCTLSKGDATLFSFLGGPPYTAAALTMVIEQVKAEGMTGIVAEFCVRQEQVEAEYAMKM